MRHRKNYRHLSRTASHRMAMLSNMAASLFHKERITTTDPKAKELRSVAEKLITLAKQGAAFQAQAEAAVQKEDKERLQAAAIHKRRLAARTLRDQAALKKLFDDIQARFETRPGGYTRIMKLGRRVGDAAQMSIIELVERRTPEVEPVEEAEASEE